ncbi:CoA transferase [Paracoccaceae bacterium]|nr:CoA transferase [Paracoccaceae bacterium]
MLEKKGILEGLRILDLSRMLSGPYATMLLADHGAEVVKIESNEGDTSRRSGPFRDSDIDRDWSGYFISLNRNKKSICLNLKDREDNLFFRELVKKSDIIVENFRPGVMARLGLSFEDLLKLNPKIVYGSISGFGSSLFGQSPYENWPSYDVVAQAMGGLISLTGSSENKPMKVGPGIADIFSGSLLSFGLLAAVLQSRTSGKGQLVEVAMYDAILSMCERAIYQYDFNKEIPKPEGNGHPLLAPFGIYSAKDGFVAIGIVEDIYWDVLKNIINNKALLDDESYGTIGLRAKNREKLNKLVNIWTKTLCKNELIELLGGKIPFGPVNNIEEILKDNHVKLREMIYEIEHPLPDGKAWKVAGNPVKFYNFQAIKVAPPLLGEHNLVYQKKIQRLNKTQNIEKLELNHTDYKGTIIFEVKGGLIKEFNINTFTFLKSTENYFVGSVSRSVDFSIELKKLKSVKVYFLQKSQEKDVYMGDNNSNSTVIFAKSISDVCINNYEKEILISIKI